MPGYEGCARTTTAGNFGRDLIGPTIQEGHRNPQAGQALGYAMDMSDRRASALAEIFEVGSSTYEPDGAVMIVTQHLDVLIERLNGGHELGDVYKGYVRYDADASIRSGAIILGRAAIEGMRGMVASSAVDSSVPMPRLSDEKFAPLDDAWQKAPEPYAWLCATAVGQRERLTGLGKQPNQLFRNLFTSVAFAADVAGWAGWTTEIKRPPAKA